MAFWGRKTLCLVTGASQGIGQEIAIQFAKSLGDDSIMILLARSEKGLKDTQKLIKESSNKVDVQVHCVDLEEPNMEVFNKILAPYKTLEFELLLLVHNAASAGSGRLAKNMNDLPEWNSYMTVNLFSMTMLTSSFMSTFQHREGRERCLVNITSLAALQPFKSLGYYCIGKVAREMYFKTLVAENPDLNVLNYAPGPVKTEMIDHVIGVVQNDETKSMFMSMKNEGKLLTTSETINKLVSLLGERKYENAAHVDYFDA